MNQTKFDQVMDLFRQQVEILLDGKTLDVHTAQALASLTEHCAEWANDHNPRTPRDNKVIHPYRGPVIRPYRGDSDPVGGPPCPGRQGGEHEWVSDLLSDHAPNVVRCAHCDRFSKSTKMSLGTPASESDADVIEPESSEQRSNGSAEEACVIGDPPEKHVWCHTHLEGYWAACSRCGQKKEFSSYQEMETFTARNAPLHHVEALGPESCAHSFPTEQFILDALEPFCDESGLLEVAIRFCVDGDWLELLRGDQPALFGPDIVALEQGLQDSGEVEVVMLVFYRDFKEADLKRTLSFRNLACTRCERNWGCANGIHDWDQKDDPSPQIRRCTVCREESLSHIARAVKRPETRTPKPKTVSGLPYPSSEESVR